jgi:hypothetical protein
MLLQGWQNFYMVTSQAAATLIGLMFVAISLGADIAEAGKTKGVAPFLTSTVVHFGGVMFNSLVVLAPWPSASVPSLLLGLSAAAGIAYLATVGRSLARIEFLNLEWDDWCYYVVIPFVANVCLLAAAVALILRAPYAPYAGATE